MEKKVKVSLFPIAQYELLTPYMGAQPRPCPRPRRRRRRRAF